MLSTTNDRLECPKALLIGLVKTVELLVDVGALKHSVFHLDSSVNHLHARVKAILKHGAKLKHHIIFSQPSFAAFDLWLEQSLIDFSLVTILHSKRDDLDAFYYDWAFLRNPDLFQAVSDVLQVLSTRDVGPMLKIMTMEANLSVETETKFNYDLQKQRETGTGTKAMPASGDPLLSSLSVLENSSTSSTETGNSSEIYSSSSTSTLAISIPQGSRSRDFSEDSRTFAIPFSRKEAVIEESECECDQDQDLQSVKSNVPSFSYSYQSPVSSPPVDRVSNSESLTLPNSSSSLLKPKSQSPLITTPSSSEETESGLGHGTGRFLSPGLVLMGQRSSSDEKLGKKWKAQGGQGHAGGAAWNESFLESGGLVLPPAIGHFPRPQKGQTLTSFLSSLSDNLPDLDRENAHFNVSEALISAFERIKIQKFQERRFSNSMSDRERFGNESGSGASQHKEDVFGTVGKENDPNVKGHDHNDPEIKPSRSRQQRHQGKKLSQSTNFTETEESELEYWRQQPRRPPPYLRKKPRGQSQGHGEAPTPHTSSSLTSSEEDFLSSSYSAENVALNLLRNSNVSDRQLPPASELQWLVSEVDAPQALLPLPKIRSSQNSEDSEMSDCYGSANSESSSFSCVGKIDNHIRLRGSMDWAPPRPQIIFTVHPPPSMNILIKTQRCRCAGCGTKVDIKYASTFRYCHYLGRYFCTGCHTGKRARLPQMIIHQWDFSPHPVSNFSATLLEKLQSDPVYNILAINRNIYKKVKLNNFRNYRIQLGILKEYIHNCKSATHLKEEMKKFPQYYSCDVDLFSLEDLVHLRFSAGLPMKTKEFVQDAIKHVLHCSLCKELGFVCEMCSRKEILFPFQINRVTRCSECASCFHLKCFNPGGNSCPKCLRISARRSQDQLHQDEVEVQAAVNVIPDAGAAVGGGGGGDGLNVAC